MPILRGIKRELKYSGILAIENQDFLLASDVKHDIYDDEGDTVLMICRARL